MKHSLHHALTVSLRRRTRPPLEVLQGETRPDVGEVCQHSRRRGALQDPCRALRQRRGAEGRGLRHHRQGQEGARRRRLPHGRQPVAAGQRCRHLRGPRGALQRALKKAKGDVVLAPQRRAQRFHDRRPRPRRRACLGDCGDGARRLRREDDQGVGEGEQEDCRLQARTGDDVCPVWRDRRCRGADGQVPGRIRQHDGQGGEGQGRARRPILGEPQYRTDLKKKSSTYETTEVSSDALTTLINRYERRHA